jgi:hypothetical protein
MALPWLMLVANVLAWLRWGTDLPFFDDWRAYDERNALSLDPKRLFEAINNTISPIGLALDVFAQRWLGGNPLPYQTLTMVTVLGGLLSMQWALLSGVIKDVRIRAVLFGFCVFMLQSGSYWGEQNLAYHQALPLLGLMAATCITFRGRLDGLKLRGAVFLAGLFAGLSYISGSVTAVALGMGWLITSLVIRRHVVMTTMAVRLQTSGVAMLLAGVLTSVVQIAITRNPAPGARRQIMDLTGPVRTDFWAFLAGCVARASGTGFTSLHKELIWFGILALAVMAAVVYALHVLCFKGGWCTSSQRRWAAVFLPLWVMVAVYLGMVGLGRSGAHDPSIQGMGEVFRFGAGRFHFFWVTLLFPWLATGFVVALHRRKVGSVKSFFTVVGLFVAVGVLAGVRGVFNVPAFYQAASAYQAGMVRCLANQLGHGQPIACPGFEMMDIRDLSRAYVYANEIKASFVRYLPVVDHGNFGVDVLNDSTPVQHESSTQQVRQGLARWPIEPPPDGRWIIPLRNAGILEGCRVLGIRLQLRAIQSDSARVFYRRRSQTEYAAKESVQKAYVVDGHETATLEFTLESWTGFEPELRIDAAEQSRQIGVDELQVVCRVAVQP